MPANARDWIIVLWPAFFAACGLSIVTFAAIDPADIDLFGWGLALEPISAYSLAFLTYWAIGGAACLVTWSLSRGAAGAAAGTPGASAGAGAAGATRAAGATGTEGPPLR
jgi:hypothetical protein